VSFDAKPWLWPWRALRPLAEWLARRPIFCRWGTSVWVGYGGLLAVGAAAAAALAVVTLPALLSPRALYTYVLGLVLSMLLGGRAAWLAYEWRALRTAPLSTLRRVGFVSFGAYAAMLLFVGVWPAQHGLWLLDRTLLACLVCSGFGRLGCLSYGCCYGRPWEHGMRADSGDSKVVRERGEAGRSPRVPTQLLHSLLAFFCAGLAGLLLLSAAAPGFAALLTALVYAFGRFGIENYRDEPRFVAGRLTRGQLLATAIGLTALVGIAFAPLGFHGDPSLLESLTPTALLDVRYWPLLLLSALSVLLVCGYHRNKLGAW
jgi:prolipoprotein diacylglyceryltransferase